MADFLISQHEQIKSLYAKTLAASGEAREKAFVELGPFAAMLDRARDAIVGKG